MTITLLPSSLLLLLLRCLSTYPSIHLVVRGLGDGVEVVVDILLGQLAELPARGDHGDLDLGTLEVGGEHVPVL